MDRGLVSDIDYKQKEAQLSEPQALKFRKVAEIYLKKDVAPS